MDRPILKEEYAAIRQIIRDGLTAMVVLDVPREDPDLPPLKVAIPFREVLTALGVFTEAMSNLAKPEAA